jgi:hypothetical protein
MGGAAGALRRRLAASPARRHPQLLVRPYGAAERLTMTKTKATILAALAVAEGIAIAALVAAIGTDTAPAIAALTATGAAFAGLAALTVWR